MAQIINVKSKDTTPLTDPVDDPVDMPYAQAGAMAVDPELAGSASGAVVFSQFFWPAALQQLTGLLADGTWVPMAAVHCAAVTGALLAGWMAVRSET